MMSGARFSELRTQRLKKFIVFLPENSFVIVIDFALPEGWVIHICMPGKLMISLVITIDRTSG